MDNEYDNCYNNFLLRRVDEWSSASEKTKSNLRRVFGGKYCIICESRLKMITFYIHRLNSSYFIDSKLRPIDVLHYKINVCKKCFKSKDKKKIEIITQAFTDAKYVHGFTSVVSSIGCKCIVGYEIDFVNVCIEKRETDRISRGIGNLCMCRLK